MNYNDLLLLHVSTFCWPDILTYEKISLEKAILPPIVYELDVKQN